MYMIVPKISKEELKWFNYHCLPLIIEKNAGITHPCRTPAGADLGLLAGGVSVSRSHMSFYCHYLDHNLQFSKLANALIQSDLQQVHSI